MSLESDLKDIRGIGDAKAEEIMTVFENHNSGDAPPEVRENLEQAMSYYENEDYSYAGKFLRRAVDGL